MATGYSFSGDREEALKARKLGDQQLTILKDLMSFQGLNQLVRRIDFGGGVQAVVSSFFGNDRVDIYAPPKPIADTATLGVTMDVLEVLVDPGFIQLCYERIAELEVDRDHANYCKDNFIPQVLSWIYSLDGLCYGWMGDVCIARYTEALLDNWASGYVGWRDSTLGTDHNIGYSSYVSSLNSNIFRYYTAIELSSAIGTYGKADYSCSIRPEIDVKNHTIDYLSLQIPTCDVGEPLDDATGPIGQFSFQKSYRSGKIKEVYDILGTGCSPECATRLYIDKFFSWEWKSKAAIDWNLRFYLLTTSYYYYFQSVWGGQIEGLTIKIAVDGDRTVFEWPSVANYQCAYWDLKGQMGNSVETTLTVSVSGRARSVPTEFGAYVRPVEIDPDTGEVVDWGGVILDDVTPNTWAWPWYRNTVQNYEYVPRGFEYFAGIYPDHPLVTGTDIGLTLGGDISDLEYVNSYVNTKYTYQVDDEVFGDTWTIMSDSKSYGDCDDFALTKAQMLLDKGWSVSRMHLEGGQKVMSYEPKRYDVDGGEIFKYVGHLWLVVDDVVLDRTGITTREAMQELYPVFPMYQVSGLEWEALDTHRTIMAIPVLYRDLDATIMTMRVKISLN